MNGIDEIRAKAEYLMKIGMLLDTGLLGNAEAARELGLTSAELDEILGGKIRALTVAKIVGHSMESNPTAEDQVFTIKTRSTTF